MRKIECWGPLTNFLPLEPILTASKGDFTLEWFSRKKNPKKTSVFFSLKIIVTQTLNWMFPPKQSWSFYSALLDFESSFESSAVSNASPMTNGIGDGGAFLPRRIASRTFARTGGGEFIWPSRVRFTQWAAGPNSTRTSATRRCKNEPQSWQMNSGDANLSKSWHWEDINK